MTSEEREEQRYQQEQAAFIAYMDAHKVPKASVESMNALTACFGLEYRPPKEAKQ